MSTSRLRCICAWGQAPSPMASRTRGVHLKKSTKSHSGPLQPRPTHTPSRRCAPCSLACFHFFFRELPLLTRPHLTQPLLLTFETAGKSAFSSPYDVSVAAARQDICTISRQLNKPCCAASSYSLCQVRSLHMLIAAAKRACGVRYVRTYTSHNPFSRVHAAYHVPVPTVHGLSDCALYLLCCLILMTSILMTTSHGSAKSAGAAQKSEK